MFKNIFCVFCFIPFFLFSGVLPINKLHAIKKAETHKQEGIATLNKLSSASFYLPDLADKRYFDALIDSAFDSLCVKDNRAKFMLVAFNLLKNVVIDSIDRYVEYRRCVREAAMHFELADFFNEISIYCNGSNSSIDKGTMLFSFAINNTTVCVLMCNCINEKKIKEVCSNNSEQLRLELIDMIENNPPTKISKKALTSATEKEKKVKKAIDLYNDKYLKEEFTNCFHAAVTWLVEADKEWNKSR